MSSRRKNGGKHTCQLCACPTQSQPLCHPCREMVERLARIWPQVNPVTRGMLHYRSLQAETEPTATVASRTSAGRAARG